MEEDKRFHSLGARRRGMPEPRDPDYPPLRHQENVYSYVSDLARENHRREIEHRAIKGGLVALKAGDVGLALEVLTQAAERLERIGALD